MPGRGHPGIRGVLFDLDGTLVDSAPDLTNALNRLRAEQALPPLPLAQLRPLASTGVRGLICAGFGLSPEDEPYAAHAERFLELYADGLCELTRPFPGVEALLEALETGRIPWGIVSNKPERFMQPLLEALGWGSRMACVVGGDTVRVSKPSPLPVLHAIQIGEMQSVPAAETLYLGDDERDIVAGRDAGVKTAVAGWGYLAKTANPASWGADWLFSEPLAVEQFLGLRP